MSDERRISVRNDREPDSSGSHVLYWMTAFRRPTHNRALDRAMHWARELGQPLVVLEAVRCDYPYASDRFHARILQGMREKQERWADGPISYRPYVEPEPGAGRGLLEAWSRDAGVVIGDDHPGFFFPRMRAAAERQVEARFELVDDCGLLPMAEPGREFTVAHSFRRHLQKKLLPFLDDRPVVRPRLDRLPSRLRKLPEGVAQRWPLPSASLLEAKPSALSRLPLDHSVGVVDEEGGSQAASRRLKDFLEDRLEDYGETRNRPDLDTDSRLSVDLHFGHLSADEVFDAIVQYELWEPELAGGGRLGSRDGWWGMSDTAEAFLDQLVTWRELGFNLCRVHDRPESFDSLPDWARETLDDHRSDPRPWHASREELEASQTPDPIWNAAQNQLRETGRLHNMMRMVWGKKLLEWTEGPEEALEHLYHLNDRYALDGRDPNTHSGVGWCLGRFDRAWPERSIFGKVRYMSTDAARRKKGVKEYLRRWSASEGD